MKEKKEKLFIRGNYVEVSIMQTPKGDYLGIAKFLGRISCGICRSSDQKTARKLSIERLFDNKELIDDIEKYKQ